METMTWNTSRTAALKKHIEIMLSNEDRERVKDNYDIYDLIEVLDLSVEEFIDAFDYLIYENKEIMEKIGYVNGAGEDRD